MSLASFAEELKKLSETDTYFKDRGLLCGGMDGRFEILFDRTGSDMLK